MRLQHYLDALILLVAEDLVGLRGVVEREAVRDDERRVNLTAFDAAEQRLHVLHHVCLPHPERESLLERGAKGNLVEESAVDAGNGDDAALTAGVNRLAQRGRAIA